MLCAGALLAASCSGSESTTSDSPPDAAEATATSAGGLRTIDAAEALSIQSDAPDDLVVLDVRTLEEFAEGHLEDAVMLDFYDPEFAAQIAELDPDAPYLLYCRSGNRSGQTIELMEQLGFTDVANLDGGILAWADAGQPVVTE